MNRNQKQVYLFIYDDSKKFYRGVQSANGDWKITSSGQMYPIKHNPINLLESPVEFGTNKRYFSMNRSINYPLEFTFDGAAILNSIYQKGKGINENLYLAVFEFDPIDGIYKLSYNGRFDFQQKKRDEKLSTFTVPLVDDSAWGIISQNDDVEYAIDCSQNNPKVIKVLFDNFTLKNRFTFQTVAAPIPSFHTTTHESAFVMPFVMVNQDGDSYGLIVRNQTSERIMVDELDGPLAIPQSFLDASNNCFFYTYYDVIGINVKGEISFTWTFNSNHNPPQLIFMIKTSFGQEFVLKHYSGILGPIVPGVVNSFSFDINMDLDAGEKAFLFIKMFGGDNIYADKSLIVTPVVTNTFVSLDTKVEPTIQYGMRPLDLLKEIVNKATLGRYTIESDFFEVNNKTVLIPGDSFREVKEAKIYTSFKDFFETFSALFFMALRVVNGSLFMELADEVYKQDNNIIDLGELMECETFPASEYYPNEIEVGSPKQDYRRSSGRLEFNSTNNFSLPFINVKNKLSLITKYRTDCFGMIFLILDYKGSSTKDNTGDKNVFVVDITDELGSANEFIETFENINVNNATLNPIIKHPLDGDIINHDLPLIKGVGIPATNVNIYVNDVLDGGTVVAGDYTWQYQITTPIPSFDPGVADGIAVIKATNTDLLAPFDSIQIVVDTTVPAATGIIYPRQGDNLYNNLPLIKGVAPNGTNIDINLDGVLLASVVADNSCKFEYKVLVPLTNGAHTLDIGGAVTNFNVNSNVEFPLITYIGSELDGFVLINNLPLIKGVARPGTMFSVWLNYISYAPLGNVTADANGNWSLQVIPVNYNDPLSGLPVVLAPIQNGLNVISTSLINNSVQISVTGYKLNRPDYDSITGVVDNTVFNTRLSPKRMLFNHKSLLSSIMDRQRNDYISFQKADKNANLRTVLGTEVIAERDDIIGSSLGTPMSRLENAKIKCIANKSYAALLNEFNSGGTVKGRFRGTDIYFLPIGNMKMRSLFDSVQEWQLLISSKTTYTQLLNLSKTGLTINLMQNSVFHSDYNTLHMVEYNKVISDKFNFKGLYDDWFTERNSRWLTNPQYIQKIQKTETIRDQIIVNGLGAMSLRMYRCRDAVLIDTFVYNAVAPLPIPPPEQVREAIIDFNLYPEDQYFFVQMVGSTAVAISERVESRAKWHDTILIEARSLTNKPGVFFSTGFKTILRIEGLVKHLQPYLIESEIAQEESGDTRMLYSNLAKERLVRYGNAAGIPDYIAMKMALAITLDTCLIENEQLVIKDGEKISPSEDIPGVPMYYYDVKMTPKENTSGKVTAGEPGAQVTGVIVVVDATAIGLPAHSLIMIEEN